MAVLEEKDRLLKLMTKSSVNAKDQLDKLNEDIIAKRRLIDELEIKCRHMTRKSKEQEEQLKHGNNMWHRTKM